MIINKPIETSNDLTNGTGNRFVAHTANSSAGTQDRPQAKPNALDGIFLNTIKPTQAAEFISQFILGRLSNEYGVKPTHSVADYSQAPNLNSAINRVINFANQISRQLPSRDHASALKDHTQNAFNDARHDLHGIAQSNQNIGQAISDYAKGLSAALEQPPFTARDIIETEYASSFDYAASQSSTLEVITKDGDRVTIELSRSLNYASGDYAHQDANSSSVYSESKMEMNAALNIRVEGDLDEEELASIQSLTEEINNITQQGGDLHSAVSRLSHAAFDSGELSSFDFSRQTHESVRAIETYREVAVQTSPVETTESQAATVANSLVQKYENLPFADLDKLIEQIRSFVEAFQKHEPVVNE